MSVLPQTTANKQPTKKVSLLEVTSNLQSNEYSSSFVHSSSFINCLQPLLEALKWPGDQRHIAESLPHFAESLDLQQFLIAMKRLHYRYDSLKINLGHIDERLFPCLFVNKDDKAMVVLSRQGDTVKVFDGDSNTELLLTETNIKGKAYLFNINEEHHDDKQRVQFGWFKQMLKQHRGLFISISLISLMMNLFVLATPIFIMSVYDRVITTESYQMLSMFSIGIIVALGANMILQLIRGRILAYIGARLDNEIGDNIIQRLLYLQPSFTESASLASQISRLKDFETIREFFTGPLIGLIFDLPFTILFIAVIAMIAGPLAIIPLVMLGLYGILAYVFKPIIEKSVGDTASSSNKRQGFLLETLSNLRVIKYSHAEKTWNKRCEEVIADASFANFRATMVTHSVNIIADALMMIAGLSVISFGVLGALNGTISVGALIATMMLVWRVLSPLKLFFSTLSRWDQVFSSLRQINNLMNIVPERDPYDLINPLNKLRGQVSFNRISIRFQAEMEPALLGITFNVKPGEVIAIIGRNGSGKSTLLKLMTNMYSPQSGAVSVDGVDIRQLDPIELRHAVGYVPQKCQLFYGTIEQNLRLANPIASDKDIADATELAGVYDDIMQLPHGFQTQLRDQSGMRIPPSLQQRLSLARAYLKKPKILLLDEPANSLDFKSDQQFDGYH